MESSLVAALFSASIAINLMAVILLYAAGRHTRSRHPYFSLILLFFCVAAYQYFNWRYHSALSVHSAINLLKFQTSFVLISIPLFYYCFSIWSKERFIHRGFFTIGFVALVLLIINWLMPASLRYDQIYQLERVTMFNGEQISLLRGEMSFAGGVYYLYLFSVLIIVASQMKALMKNQLPGIAFALILFVLLQTGAAISAFLVNQGSLNTFYLAGFTTTLLVVMICFNIAQQVDIQTRRLRKQIKRHQQVRDAINMLATEVANVDSLSFYQQVVLNLQRLFAVKTALVGLYHKKARSEWIETLAISTDGRLTANIDYELEHTPCASVINRDFCVISQNVCERFPHDRMLSEQNMQAYIGVPLVTKDNEVLGLIALLHDQPYRLTDDMRQTLMVFAARVSAELQRSNVEAKLRHIAYFDYTTGLPNRARLHEKIRELYKTNTQNNAKSILLLFDLDRFKDINRIFGYDVAEDVLKELGKRFEHYASDNYFVARNDGDEFAVLIQRVETESAGLIQINWQALQAIIKAPINIGSRTIKLDCSMGAVVFPEQTGTRFDVIRSAESALQQAKRTGRSRYSIFDPDLQRKIDRITDIENSLRKAMAADNQLFLLYQPQTLADGTMIGFEVLVRWQHPQKGLVSPAEFIPVAEQAGLIVPLSEWIFNTALKQVAKWRADMVQLPPHVSLNVSAIHLSEEHFVDTMITLAEQYQVPTHMLVLELTESGLLEDLQRTIIQLRRLREAGFKIALDDFGTGYSSLSYLRDLPLDFIKIDKSFVDELFQSGTKEMVESILFIGKHMHLDIIAEGVESEKHVNLLTDMGCQYFQGYYFSRPLDREAIPDWKFVADRDLSA